MAWHIDAPVIVPFDFSDHSRAAFQRALQLTDPENTHVVHVLPVFTPPEPGVGWGLLDDPQRFSQANKGMEHAMSPEHYPVINLHVLLGEPGTVVPDLVKELGAELVVIGSHGRTGISRLVVGSVAEQVFRCSPCPVLVIKLPKNSEKSRPADTEIEKETDEEAVTH